MTRSKCLSLNIRERLVRLEMSQRSLAEAVGLAPTALSARLRGDRDFRFSELAAIADVLGVPLKELVDFEIEEGQR